MSELHPDNWAYTEDCFFCEARTYGESMNRKYCDCPNHGMQIFSYYYPRMTPEERDAHKRKKEQEKNKNK